MLDVRVYRAAFLPALIALFVAAFSLQDRPAPTTTGLSADAFDSGNPALTSAQLSPLFVERKTFPLNQDPAKIVSPATARLLKYD